MRINPMIIEGQIHGGLAEGFTALMGQQMPFDAQRSLLGDPLMDCLLPTAVETPKWEADFTATSSPHHPLGAKGVAMSLHVGQGLRGARHRGGWTCRSQRPRMARAP